MIEESMMSHYGLRNLLNTVKKQAYAYMYIWTNVDHVLWRHVAPLEQGVHSNVARILFQKYDYNASRVKHFMEYVRKARNYKFPFLITE